MTHMDEFAYSINGENAPWTEPPSTPWHVEDPRRVIVRRSAVAVAGAPKEVDFALGTDSGGSVRVPASLTGCYGFRPTHGTVALDGASSTTGSLAAAGWMSSAIPT